MKKESPVGLFFSMFLKAIVVILGFVIVVFGILIVTKVVKGSSGSKAPSTTVGENVLTDAESRDDLLYNETTAAPYKDTEDDASTSMSKDEIKIMVLNSTDISGLAGRWCTKLNDYGYPNADASDYSETLSNTKIVAVSDGVGKELVKYFKNATYEVGTVTENISESMDGYDVVIIIGSADDDGEGQEDSSNDSGYSDDSYDDSYDESDDGSDDYDE